MPLSRFTSFLSSCLFAGTLQLGLTHEAPAQEALNGTDARVERLLAEIPKNPENQKRVYLGLIMTTSDTGYMTQDIIDQLEVQRRAQIRAGLISGVYMVDLDGDGVVTREEAEKPFLQRGRHQNKHLTATMVLYSHDLDGDGALSFQEVLAYAEKESRVRKGLRGAVQPQYEVLMTMDMNKDGRTELKEVVDFIDAAAADAEAGRARKGGTLRVLPADAD